MTARPAVRSLARVFTRPLSAVAAMVVMSACQRGPASEPASDSAAASALEPRDPQFLTPYGKPVNPFSPAVRAGNLLFLAGEIGTDSTGQLVKGGIEAETKQVMDNIQRTLAATGSSMERVVKCTVFMADMKEWPAMNVVYATYFPNNKPARSALGATALARDARVEIECIAMAGR